MSMDKYNNYYLAENNVSSPDLEFIIYTGHPACVIKFKPAEAYGCSQEAWRERVASISWINTFAPALLTQQNILNTAWEYLREEERLLDTVADETEG